MAKSHTEVLKEQEAHEEEEHVSGITSFAHLRREKEEEKEGEEEALDLAGAVKKFGELIREERAGNERLVRELGGMIEELKDVVSKVEELKSDSESEQHQQAQMALRGVANAQRQAEQMTVNSVRKVTEESTAYIDKMVEESRRRIERLSMVTLPDRLFYYGKWLALLLVLIILVHIVWQVMI